MVRLKSPMLLASALTTLSALAHGSPVIAILGSTATVAAKIPAASPVPSTSTTRASAPWPVETSLKSTLRAWAHRQGWPAPQFLTEADWVVDVSGSIQGSIEDALKALAEGFGKAPTRPRIEISANHVMLVSEVGAE
jgi:hypothetical protein